MEELTYFTPAKLLEVANNPIEAKAGSPVAWFSEL